MFVEIVAILIVVYYLWAKYKLNYWQRLGVPTLPTNIIFGNFKDIIFRWISPGFLLGRLYNEVESDTPFVGVYIMHKPFLLFRDPELIKQILIKDSNIFQNRLFTLRNRHDKLGNDNLFSVNNPEWRYLRQKLSFTFSSGKLKQLFGLMVETSKSLKKFMNVKFMDNPDEVKSIDVRSLSAMYTTDIFSSIAFGVTTNSFEKSTSDFYVRSCVPYNMTLYKMMQSYASFFFPSLTCLFDNSFFGKNTGYIRDVFWSSMNSREASKIERGDVIDTLLKLKNENEQSNFKFEGDTLAAQSVVFFIAGRETSAVTMAFALWELARHPQIQTRVRHEIVETLQGNSMTYESINDMQYLMQVIDETLRLYPPAPLIDRVASKDYKIPNTDIVLEKGTVVYVPLPGIHRDPKYFPNPEQFDPDRFSHERKQEMISYTYLPFGDGPRVCIGSRLGMLQTAVGLVTVLREYEVSIDPSYQAKICPRSVFVKPASDGVHLYFKKLVI